MQDQIIYLKKKTGLKEGWIKPVSCSIKNINTNTLNISRSQYCLLILFYVTQVLLYYNPHEQN